MRLVKLCFIEGREEEKSTTYRNSDILIVVQYC